MDRSLRSRVTGVGMLLSFCDRVLSLNDAHIPNFRGVCVHVSYGPTILLMKIGGRRERPRE
jgi:hypothetical protein